MKGSIVDYSRGWDGSQRLVLALDGDFRKEYDKYRDVPIDVEIKKWSPRRSDAANRFMWVLCDKIAVNQHLKKEQIYRDAIRSIGGVSSEVVVLEDAYDELAANWCSNGTGWQATKHESEMPGYVRAILYPGSSTFNTLQMSLLIDCLVQQAEDLEINIDTPEKAAYYEYLDREDKLRKGRKIC